MTTKQLMIGVKALTSEYDYFDEDAFIASANVALCDIYSEINVIGRASLYITSPRHKSYTEELRHTGGEVEKIPLDGAAYSFRVFGKGEFVIKSTTLESHTFDGQGVEFKGFIDEKCSLEFKGETSYTVRNLTVFSERESDEVTDIPIFGSKKYVSVRGQIPDFSRAISLPTSEDGKPLSSVFIDGDSIVCPSDFRGSVCFKYKKTAPSLTANDLDRELEIPPEAQSLLVQLTGAYIIGDVDSGIARLYMNEYKSSVLRLRTKLSRAVSENYTDTTGWA